MKHFSDFINENKEQTNFNKEDIKDNEQLEDMIDKYSAYSSDQLMSEFMKLTIEKKKRGELNKNELMSIKETIAPMLNAEQKSNLDKIINMVDNV